MKKTLVTFLAAVSLMGGFATVATGCSNNSSTQQAEQHSAKKVTKDEIKGHDYVGVSADNKDEYLTFFTGKDKKKVQFVRVSKNGSQKAITDFKKSKLVLNKKDPKKFKIDGFRIIKEPDFEWNFVKVGKTTIKSPDGKKWKLYNGTHKQAVKAVQKNGK
ncbi:hypothetical protein FD29_GL002062 [Companilactobacillus mindensis DSM 14500]|uniref:Lipoprotein n=1 Tax=Companilactobacillus mindensis DSM 14500 TaxID=1423770 RepID=A0A0R1QJ55_9LACO|nr:hypothetical protein [Companilactobacillus mindensis]KRL44636.1 hypothetical protein FD29_GL002062 [Companilactobacillus mindensis DSM 14500]GEO78542.1 hypothetical protein LMI01_08730 [Companilactobacillus mindensis]